MNRALPTPVDAQLGLHLSRYWRLTVTAFGTKGHDFSHISGVLGFEGGIE